MHAITQATPQGNAMRAFAERAVRRGLAANASLRDGQSEDVVAAMTEAVARNPGWVVARDRLAATVADIDVAELRRASAARVETGRWRDAASATAAVAEIHISCGLSRQDAPDARHPTAETIRVPKPKGANSHVAVAPPRERKATRRPPIASEVPRRVAHVGAEARAAARRAGLRIRSDGADPRTIPANEIVCLEALSMLASRGVATAAAVLRGLRDNPANAGRNLTTFYVRGMSTAVRSLDDIASNPSLTRRIARLDLEGMTRRAKAEQAGKTLYVQMRRFSELAAEALAVGR